MEKRTKEILLGQAINILSQNKNYGIPHDLGNKDQVESYKNNVLRLHNTLIDIHNMVFKNEWFTNDKICIRIMQSRRFKDRWNYKMKKTPIKKTYDKVITIRISKTMYNWIKKNKYSNTKMFRSVCKELGYEGE